MTKLVGFLLKHSRGAFLLAILTGILGGAACVCLLAILPVALRSDDPAASTRLGLAFAALGVPEAIAAQRVAMQAGANPGSVQWIRSPGWSKPVLRRILSLPLPALRSQRSGGARPGRSDGGCDRAGERAVGDPACCDQHDGFCRLFPLSRGRLAGPLVEHLDLRGSRDRDAPGSRRPRSTAPGLAAWGGTGCARRPFPGRWSRGSRESEAAPRAREAFSGTEVDPSGLRRARVR